eukprot:3707530-Rhodomonas_salina.1
MDAFLRKSCHLWTHCCESRAIYGRIPTKVVLCVDAFLRKSCYVWTHFRKSGAIYGRISTKAVPFMAHFYQSGAIFGGGADLAGTDAGGPVHAHDQVSASRRQSAPPPPNISRCPRNSM